MDGSSREIVPVNLVSEKGEVVSVNGTWIMEVSPDLQKPGAMLARAIGNYDSIARMAWPLLSWCRLVVLSSYPKAQRLQSVNECSQVRWLL